MNIGELDRDGLERYAEKLALDRRIAYDHIATQRARIRFLFEQLEQENERTSKLVADLRQRVRNQRKELRQFYERTEQDFEARAESAEDRSGNAAEPATEQPPEVKGGEDRSRTPEA